MRGTETAAPPPGWQTQTTLCLEPTSSRRSRRILWVGLAKEHEQQERQAEDNRIDDIAPLAGLTELQQLILSYNNVKDLGPLAGLQALLFLNLVGNAVEDVSPLFPLASLQELVLIQNPLIPCSQLDELEEALPETRVLAYCGG